MSGGGAVRTEKGKMRRKFMECFDEGGGDV